MHRFAISCFFILYTFTSFSQKIEQGFNVYFQPTDEPPRYLVITEREGDHWHRQAYYLPERSMAMEAWYLDSNAKVADGEYSWYFTNKKLNIRGTYRNGKKEGAWLRFHDNGMISDSTNYVAGRKKGIGLGWSSDGSQTDSSNFDGNGNGTTVHWYPDGTPSSAGLWVADTSKNKRWQYFHPNGKLMATETYDNGKRLLVSCYDEQGTPLATCDEKEAVFSTDETGWQNYIRRNLNGNVPVRKRAPVGRYTVMIRFVVDKDGNLTDITPETKFGFGMEEEVIRLLKKSPRWIPAIQFGRKVKAYRKQPITFQVIQD